MRLGDVLSTMTAMRWGLAAAACAAAFVVSAGPAAAASRVEVIAQLDAPSLSQAISSSRALKPSVRRERLDVRGALGTGYLAGLGRMQDAVALRIRAEIPSARIRWHYRITLNALAVTLPESKVNVLRRVAGVSH